MANGSGDDQLRLEAARKRLKIERTTSESESPLDAQICRMQKELEELKKQRQVVELQEQILAEQQLLLASRHRLSMAAASVSPKSSPAPASVLSTPAVPTPPVPRFAPQSPQAVVKPTIERNNSRPTPSPSVNQAPVPFPVPVQQSQPPRPLPQAPRVQASPTIAVQATNGQALPKAQSQALGVQSWISPVGVKRESNNNTPNQVQALSIPKVDNGLASVQAQRSNGIPPSIPNQEQQQQLWFDRPRTPGAPENATLEKIRPYQGLTRDEYTTFVSTLEAHFAKSPQYYSEDRKYRQIKLGLQHLAPAQRDNWFALPDRSDSWQNFRAFLLKEVVRNSKFMEQVRSAGTPQPPAPEVEKPQNPAATQIPPAMQPPQAASNTPKAPPQHSGQQFPQASPNHSFLFSNGVSASDDLTPPRAKAIAAAEAFAAYSQSKQRTRQTVMEFSEWLQSLGFLLDDNLSLNDRMSCLKKGVVAPVRNRAHRPFSYFKSYDEYLFYLQDIEDTLPQRQAELKGRGLPQGLVKTSSSWVAVPWDEKANGQTARQPSIAPRGYSPVRGETVQGNNQKGPQTPAGSGARSHATPGHLVHRPDSGSSPTSRESVARRMSSPTPPELGLKPTDGKDFWACRNYINNLESHFKEYHHYYTEERKVAAGRRYIAPCLRGEWNAYAGKHQRMTWFDVCAFVCNQAATKVAQPDAARQYLRSNQKPLQSVRDYALWVQLYAPHCTRPGWDERRHLWDRISSDITKRASKDFNNFKDLSAFVAYLEAVERTSPNTPKDHGSQNLLLPVLRKRGRTN